MKLFLIDAYALIYRSYYAFIKNPRINSKGMNTSAIFGFINSLEDVLKREKPTHVAVAFDPDPLYSPGERAVACVRGLSGGVSARCRSESQVVENQRT